MAKNPPSNDADINLLDESTGEGHSTPRPLSGDHLKAILRDIEASPELQKQVNPEALARAKARLANESKEKPL